MNRWASTSGGVTGGGIWGPGGVIFDQQGGAFIYTATGNANNTPENVGFAERVVKLDSGLNVIASNGPALTSGEDLDFGSTPLPFQPPGCPRMLAVMNKSGQVFVYNREGSAISNGPFQVINVNEEAGGAFIGMLAYDPSSNQVFFGNNMDSHVTPAYTHGLVAMHVQSNCTLALNWVQTVGIANEPVLIPAVVANGVVYYPAALNSAATLDSIHSVLYAFDTTGHPLWNSGQQITAGIFTAPTVVNGMLLVADGSGKITSFTSRQ